MRVSLWLKLMGIFVVIIATGVVVMFVVVNLATATQFRRFILSSDLIQAQNLVPILADYYAQQGSWQGMETLLPTGPQPAVQSGAMSGMMGPGMMRPGVMGPEMMREMSNAMRWEGSLTDRVVLVDAGGIVVADSAGVLVGQRHPDEHLAAGGAIVIDGQRVGTVLVDSMVEPALNPLDQDFLRSVNLAVLLSAMAVGVVALVLGSIFFFQITAPVRRLTQAAEAIAAGNMDQRVVVRTGDEIGRLAQAFNTMTNSLERAETLRRQMVADIAHELRTPLSLVQGNLEAIQDGLYELNLENVASVHEETLVLTRLVNDLHDLALAEAGQLCLQRGTVALADLVERAVEGFRAQAAGQEITLVTELSPDLPLISGDEQRLNQVLINLLSNALHHTPPGGRIVVSVKQVSTEKQGSRGAEGQRGREASPLPPCPSAPLLLISVADTGRGIPSEDLPHVFERFYRADKSRARTSGGSGLGLAIARQIVEAHGGRIRVESWVGVGSTFFVALPGLPPLLDH
jgi:two-component system OmpR family sensor kinase/two-component system sensor histidine kinase BaeS